MTVLEFGRSLRARKISCLELMQQTLSAIRAGDEFNSFITPTFDAALEEARALDQQWARDRGSFHGIPIAHKDLYYTRGVRTTAGSLLFKDFVPDFDGAVVANLRIAGAVSVGKTNLHELAYGITSANPHFGPVLNPRAKDRIPGGSSGGSAALVAAGLLPVATGTDTGGSIRIPASYCGITGLKPTYDLLSRRGILPLNHGLDHAGPLAGCIEDCALAMNAMAGSGTEFNLAALANAEGLRIGVPKAFFFEGLQADVERAVRTAIEQARNAGAMVREVMLPDFEAVNAAARVVQLSEAAALYVNYSDPALFGKDIWANLQDGHQIMAHEYVNAQRLRRIFRRQMDRLWRGFDVIVTPTTAITAPLQGAATVDINGRPEDTRLVSTRLVRGWNYLGEPALSMPCGTDRLNLPIGMQLIAAPYADARLLQIAGLFERLLN